MSASSIAAVRRFMLDSYDEIKQRLAHRLGSVDLASDALQDAWLKLARSETVSEVHSPRRYVLSVAMNAARDRMKEADSRILTRGEVDDLIDVPDESPDPARIAEGRSELRRLEAVIAELSQRQRAILLAARVENLPRQEIARRLGISLRLVEYELQRAVEYCLEQHGGRRGK